MGPGRRFARAWWLALRILRVTLRAQAEYRVEFVVSIVSGILWQTSLVVFATVVITRFPTVGAWQGGDVLLLASVRMLAHALYVLVNGRLPFDFESMLHEGRLAAFYLRPLPLHRQVQLAHVSPNALGDLAVAVFLLALGAARSTVPWSAGRVAYLAAAIVGGMLVESAISTVLAALVLHLPSTFYWSDWVHELTETFGSYPLSILPRAAASFFTFVLPLAFVAYLPVGILTGHGPQLGVPVTVAALSPVLGVGLSALARLAFDRSLRSFAAVNV